VGADGKDVHLFLEARERRRGRDQGLHEAAEQRVQGLTAALIRDVRELDAGIDLELLGGKKMEAADARGRIIQGTVFFFRIGDEFLEVRDRQRLLDGENG